MVALMVRRNSLYEPHERAERTRTFDANDVAVDHATKEAGEGARPLMTDVDYRLLETPEDLIKYIEQVDESISAAEIAKRLKKQPTEYIVDTLKSVAAFASDGNYRALDELRFTDDRGLRTTGAGGSVTLDVLVRDTADQLLDLSNNIADIDAVGGELREQALKFLNRSKTLVMMKKEATVQSSHQLQNWKKIPPNVKESMQQGTKVVEEKFNDLIEVFAKGDPDAVKAAKEDLLQFAKGVAASNGDPIQMASFWSAFARMGVQNFNQVTINAWLSSPLSQVRNLAGNAYVA